MSSDRELQILCLHGFRTNDTVMKFQLQGFQHAFSQNGAVHFHIPHAPHTASGPAHTSILDFFGSGKDYFEWWNYEKRTDTIEIFKNGDLEKSIAYLQEYIKVHGPFDAILGFSQGSSLASLLTATYFKKSEDTGCSMPWKWTIHVSGALVRDDVYGPMLTNRATPLPVHSLFLIGDDDYLNLRTRELTKIYETSNQHVYCYPEGHKFPSARSFATSYSEIATLIRNHLLEE